MAGRSFFDEVRAVADSLGAEHAALATELIDAIESGSTGSEIMMRLRTALRGACDDAALDVAHRDRLRELHDQVESVLK